MRRHRVLVLFIVSLSLLPVGAIRAGDPTRVATPVDKIHVIMLTDDSDPESIGPGAANNERFISSLFENQIGTLRKGDFVKLKGSAGDLTKAKVFAAIDKLKVGANDTLVCYISEHAGFDGEDPVTHFFQFPNGEPLLRVMLYDRLKQKSARLTILLSDSCFSSTNAEQNLSGASAAPATNALYFLLRYYQGDVDINGASPFNYGIYIDAGGIFSRAFWNCALHAPANGTWSDFFHELKVFTKAEFMRDFGTAGAGIGEPPGVVFSQEPYLFSHK